MNLTTTQAAKRIGKPVTTIRYWCTHGLKAEKVGRDWLIDEQALLRYQPRKSGRPRKVAR